MGCVYKRNETYWIKYYKNGKPYCESSKSTKETDAKNLLKKREGEIAEGKLPGCIFDRVKFDELAKDLLTDYKINERKSLEMVEYNVNHLKEFFGGMRVTQITSPKINDYIQKRLNEGAMNATINRELSALRRMLNLGARQTPPRVDRVPYIAKLKENNVRKGFFEHGDFMALKNTLPEYLKVFALFGYKTGWRKSEVENLEWIQVDLEQGIVRLEPGETKNDDGRTVYLDGELTEMLRGLWEGRRKAKKILPWVFLNDTGTDKIRDFRGSWDRACKEAGIGKRLFHDLRRTAVRNMVRSGTPERVVMMVSGHKTRSVFDRYNIVSDSDLKLAASRQEAYLQSQGGYKTVTMANFQKKAASAISKKAFINQNGAREGTRTPTGNPTRS